MEGASLWKEVKRAPFPTSTSSPRPSSGYVVGAADSKGASILGYLSDDPVSLMTLGMRGSRRGQPKAQKSERCRAYAPERAF
jgi:hypothetical protein